MIRFTIRDVLWLTLVVGMAFGWYLSYSRLTRDAASNQTKSKAILEQRDASIAMLQRDRRRHLESQRKAEWKRIEEILAATQRAIAAENKLRELQTGSQASKVD